MTKPTRQNLIEEIIAKELDMFLAVNNRGGTSSCQEKPEAFRLMREISHGVLPDIFLESYLSDLKQAEKDKRNFMTEKYALMENQIPVINDSPYIAEIVKMESEWRKEVAAQFPRSVQPDGHESFCLYLGCELQTYSAETLTAYHDFVKTSQQECRNLVRDRYELLMQKLGHESLTKCEASLTAAR